MSLDDLILTLTTVSHGPKVDIYDLGLGHRFEPAKIVNQSANIYHNRNQQVSL